FLRESLARTNNIAQKIFSSIAHIQQSSKKFLAKNNSVARARELSSPLLVSHRCEFARRCARENRTNSSRDSGERDASTWICATGGVRTSCRRTFRDGGTRSCGNAQAFRASSVVAPVAVLSANKVFEKK